METIEQTLDQGLRLYQAGQHQQAEKLYRQVLDADPGQAVAWHLLGILALQNARTTEAVNHFRQALALDPENASALSNLGIAHDALGNFDQAENCFRAALRLYPTFTEAEKNLQICLARKLALKGEGGISERDVLIRQVLLEADKIGMIQIPQEIEALAKLVYDLNPQHLMEIGSHQGGTFYAWCKLARRPGKRISVDLAGGLFGGLTEPEIVLRNQRMQTWSEQVYCLNADSHAPETLQQVEKILAGDQLDFLLIDGDHTYSGVKQDYEMYETLVRPGGYIAFHDINDTPSHREVNCNVAQLWIELSGDKIEFTQRDFWGGIGVLRKP